jgi:N-acetylglucosamine transport system substrate-binding protein
MIPDGTWLYNEMKNTMPPGAQMEYMLPPVVAGGKGDPTAVIISIEPWMVPSKAQNPNAAIAYYKYMTSLPKAKQFVQEKATLMSIKGANDGPLPVQVQAAADAFKNSKDVYAVMFREWYPTFEKAVEDGLTSMLTNNSTPEQFVDRCEKAADAARSDSSLLKHKLTPTGVQ